MAKSKWRQDQDGPMDTYAVKLTARHARHARERGGGNMSQGVREIIEKDAGEMQERRTGARDRRRRQR